MSKSRRENPTRVTIKDVAQVAGVSVTTVSNVLNGRTEAMTEETLQRIQETIRVLGYRPSSVARSLVTKRTATIGVMIAEIETAVYLQTLNFIEPIARNAGYNILLSTTTHKRDDEKQAIELLLENQVDGIVSLSTSTYLDDDYLAQLPPTIPPMVLFNRSVTHDRFDQINVDNTNGVIRAIDYLVGLGHQQIAHLYGPKSRISSLERLEGYQLGLEKHGLEYNEQYVRSGDFETTQEHWEQSTQQLLDLSPRPTAIIGANDRVAAVVMRTAQRAGLRVPEDMSIIGIDDQPFCTYLNPALTTIDMSIIEIGKRAIRMLLERINRTRTTTEHVILRCPLIIRESSGPAPSAAH
ncbi:MAG: LacI family DNA-binding transcriptional regulator [Anaerolineae bacterium]|nr:LacI family DNA-binding transcriptional regulator [Anaerolineae bacterium]